MKRILIIIAGISLFIQPVIAQNNTFPASGSVGIGTTLPTTTLQVNGGGIKLTNSGGYPNGINIDMNATGGWAREYSISYGGTGKLFSLGAYGTGNLFHYGYIGGNTSQISAYSTPWMVFLPSGKIGIGTRNPLSPLQIHESSNSGGTTLRIDADDNLNPNIMFTANNTVKANIRVKDDGDDQLQFQVGSSLTEAMSINTNGNVGIGTTSPQSKLAVNGTIISQKIKVSQTGWPDYVFNHTFKLPSLVQIEKFIQRHKHLPDIPSRREISNKGLDIGNMQKKQMQKIEEIMLYLIKMNKKQTTLEKQVKELKTSNQQLVEKIRQLKPM